MFGLHGSAVYEPHPKRHIIFVQTKEIYLPPPFAGRAGVGPLLHPKKTPQSYKKILTYTNKNVFLQQRPHNS